MLGNTIDIDRRRAAFVLSVVLALAAALRTYGLRFGLPHTETRPDETVLHAIAL